MHKFFNKILIHLYYYLIYVRVNLNFRVHLFFLKNIFLFLIIKSCIFNIFHIFKDNIINIKIILKMKIIKIWKLDFFIF